MTTNTRTISALRPFVVMVALFFTGFLAISSAAAQQFPGQPQLGLSVQLPVIRNFSVQTSVRVPDGGTVALGGLSGSSEGSRASGVPGLGGRPFRNSATGRSTSVARSTVTTRVISQKELEAELLGESTAKGENQDFSSSSRPFLSQPHVGTDGESSLVPVPPDVERLANYLTLHVGRRTK